MAHLCRRCGIQMHTPLQYCGKRADERRYLLAGIAACGCGLRKYYTQTDLELTAGQLRCSSHTCELIEQNALTVRPDRSEVASK